MSSSETAVLTYEGVALGLNTAKAFIKGREVSGQLREKNWTKRSPNGRRPGSSLSRRGMR